MIQTQFCNVMSAEQSQAVQRKEAAVLVDVAEVQQYLERYVQLFPGSHSS